MMRGLEATIRYREASQDLSLDLVFYVADADQKVDDRHRVQMRENISRNFAEMMSKDAWISFVYQRVQALVMHELDEAFRVNGKHLRNPHE